MKFKYSPHLTIYRFPLTALSSITNRITGFYLTGTFLGFGLLQWTPIKTVTVPFQYQKMWESSLVFASSYHVFGGLRHFLWDFRPQHMSLAVGTWSSVAMFASASIMTGAYATLSKQKDFLDKKE